MGEERVWHEELRVSGENLLATVKELIRQGNVRRIIIKNQEHRSVVEIPLTVCVVGAVLAPQLAAIGAVAALITDCTIVVEKTKE